MEFQKRVIAWYLSHKRDLPWRNCTDPYIIWLSEIILQQTRINQGLPYFLKFLERFPTVKKFSEASEEEILKLWQGLGYYSRGRNMLSTAKMVMKNFDGVFPVRYKDLITLKGIGDYTAAAISSFSSGEERAVLDGNVFRVLARYYGLYTPINSPAGKKEFLALAQQLIINQDAAQYNQAIMEFGALQCKPVSPDCGTCVLAMDCYANKNNKVAFLPVKLKKSKPKLRYINYFFCRQGDNILVHHRQKGDIWQHLYDFPFIETNSPWMDNQSNFITEFKLMFGSAAEMIPLYHVKHLLTHQTMFIQFFEVKNFSMHYPPLLSWVSVDRLKSLPQPKVIEYFMSKYYN